MKRLFGCVAATLAIPASLLGTTAASAQETHTTPVVQTAHPYLVVLRGAPAASYRGGVPGYPATAPSPGQRFDESRPAVAPYQAYLQRRQDRLLRRVGSPEVLYSYTTALDGFAAPLTASQAKTLSSSPEVLLVQRDSRLSVDETGTAPGPLPLGERLPTRLWNQAGGMSKAGKGEVIGVIDTGIGPDNPSLAGIPLSASTLEQRYPGFTGVCVHGRRWTSSTCNSKVIAAQYFARGFGAANVATSDYLSPRDGSGHGTSVAAIAAGNAGIDTEIGGQSFGHISGMAPAAALSIYKACWSAPDPSRDGCDTADVVAAIDRAVRDGVDVLNFSVGGPSDSVGDAVSLAFRNAAAANVFVVASAGNGGPAPGSVEHPDPWVTTVGANTHDVFEGGVRLGDGTTYVGAMLSDKAVGPAPLVYAGDAPAAGVRPGRAALCYAGSLDAQRVEGAIIVCDRGITSRVSKSAAVAQSGGSAMVLVNTRPESVDADLHAVPTVHLAESAGRAVKAYVRKFGEAATASIRPDATDHPPAPVVARFSGRGPTPVAGGNLLKPDLTAPGVSVVTADSSPTAPSRRWDVESGTSIAAPHVAGVAAVIKAVHPDWSPASVKSAMMTTARPLQGSNNPLVRGAGELNPGGVLHPGLVYDNHAATTAGEVNQPSISVGDLVGQETVTRTVTNVGSTQQTYTASVQGLRGIGASIAPATLTLAPGQARSFTVTFTATKHARYDRFAAGSLTWRDGSGDLVTSPLVVRPELASVPTELAGDGPHGTVRIAGVAGVTGTLDAASTGVVGTIPIPLTLHPQAFDPSRPTTSEGTAQETLTVPAHSRATRFEVTTPAQGGNVDLYVYRGGQLIASSAHRSGDETVTLSHPRPGSYRVYVNANSAETEATVQASLSTWILPRTPQGNLTLDPASLGVDGGRRFVLSASWSGLGPNKRWWGIVTYRGLPSVTYITVN